LAVAGLVLPALLEQRAIDTERSVPVLAGLSIASHRERPACAVAGFDTRADLLVEIAVAGCIGAVALTSRTIPVAIALMWLL
jgi:hypothetical protein